MSLLDFLTDKAGKSLSPEIQTIIEAQSRDLIASFIDIIPPQEDLERLGKELGVQIIEYIHTNVLNEIYYRVEKDVALNGFEVGAEKRQELYDLFVSKLPTIKTFEVMGIPLHVNIHQIVKSALTFEKFCQIVDDFIAFLSGVSETVKPEAITIAKRIGLGVALGGFVVGSLCMFGFMRLYESTTDAPFKK